MSRTATHRGYILALLALIALVSIARYDLVLDALERTLAGLARGTHARLYLLFEICLLGGILLFTIRVIGKKVAPKQDAAIFVIGALLGYLAETWGTRLHLWRYYTGETPPLWIVPAWPLGALVIVRMSEKARSAWGKILTASKTARAYWTTAAACMLFCLLFAQPAIYAPATWAMLVFLSVTFLWKPKPEQDLWILWTGMFYVFFADLWGTSNYCWRYYIQHPPSLPGSMIGIGFGMLFDSAIVLAVIKTARALIERKG